MKIETQNWLKYALENSSAARLLMENGYYNACLQNAQQAVEKFLKAMLIEFDAGFKKTHSIFELKNMLSKKGIETNISDEHCDFFDSIYIPSKYPVGSALPDFQPDQKVCEQAVLICEQLAKDVKQQLAS
jgi:HEPN domain-containing protein